MINEPVAAVGLQGGIHGIQKTQNRPVEPSLRLLYTSSVEVGPPMVVGSTPYGQRRIIPIKGGAFAGPRLSGKILPGGADWQVIRTDGAAELEARYTLQTDDGALIYVLNRGFVAGPRK